MTIQTLILLISTGVLAGIVAGGLGVGGGIIIVPALVFVFGMTQHEAQGTSLAVLLFPVGILAVWNYQKKGFVNFHYAFVLVLAFIIGSYFGSKLSIAMPDKLLKKLFGILMVVAGARMILSK